MPRRTDADRPRARCRLCGDRGTVLTDLPGHPSAHRVPCPQCSEPPRAATIDEIPISSDESASRMYAARTLGPVHFVEYLDQRRREMYSAAVADSLAGTSARYRPSH